MAYFLDSGLLGLEYALLAVGVYLSFRVMNIPDLTVDGSFVFGLAASAVCAAAGFPLLGLLAALAAGFLSGAVTGVLHAVVGIPAILAGILTMSGLYTVNIMVLGGPNISLVSQRRFYQYLPFGTDAAKLVAVLLILAVCILLLTLFFKTSLGLCVRATGDNEDMVRASSINTTLTKIVGLSLANAMVALCGGMLAQYQGFADITSGAGMIVVGLASVIIGETICGRRSVGVGLVSAVVGSVVYRVVLALALKYNIISSDALKLVSAVIVAITLAVPAIRRAVANARAKRRGRAC